ncbi:hypothetical protein [Streptomyces sp. NPDC055243]|uniref:hypothetical protein n=1 Tax=Streptomyces sp. NPDC055243 TaxID=3365720 RepID=UPI0037CF6FAB
MSFADRGGDLTVPGTLQKPHRRTAVGRGGTRIAVPRRTPVTGRLTAQRPRRITWRGRERDRLLPGSVRLVERDAVTGVLADRVRGGSVTGTGNSAGAVRGLGPRPVRPCRRLALTGMRGRRLGTGARTMARARLRKLGHVGGAGQTGDAGRARQVGRLGHHPLRRPLENPGRPIHDRPHNTPRGTDNGLGGIGHRLDRSVTHGLDLSVTHWLDHPLTHGLGDPLTHGLDHPLTHGLGDPLTHGLDHPLTHGLGDPLAHGLGHPLTRRGRRSVHRMRPLTAQETQREQPGQQQHHLQRTPPGHGARHAHGGIGQNDCCGSQDEGFLCWHWAGRGPEHGPGA